MLSNWGDQISMTLLNNPQITSEEFAERYHVFADSIEVELTDRELIYLDHILWAESVRYRNLQDCEFILDLATKIIKSHNKIVERKVDEPTR